jgi:hypothetical protein
MATIETIHNETRRGCGYRKQGGTYLMGGGLSIVCGKLPLILETCPCCGGGIKPSRGWTWINPSKLFPAGDCSLHAVHGFGCVVCPLREPADEKAGLLWIGDKFYSVDAFTTEAAHQGVSRRISQIPRDFEVGKTRVFFAHRKVRSRIVDCTECNGDGQILLDGDDQLSKCQFCDGAGKREVWDRGIFHSFVPDRIEYVVRDDDPEDKLERLEKRGVKLVRLTWDDQEAADESSD